MKFLDSLDFWKIYWSVYFGLGLILLVIPDIIAVIRGSRDHVGDEFTFTHWLIKYVGLSVIGAFIGYLIAHFLIVHHNG